MVTYGAPWEKKKKRERVHNENRDKEKGKKYPPRPTGYYNIIIYYNIHDCRCNRILVLIKFLKFVNFFFVKIGDPYPMCVLSTLESTYVKICGYVRDCQHMSKYVHVLPFPTYGHA